MKKCMRQTLRKQKEQLDILLDTAQEIQIVFVAEINYSDAHIPNITKGKYISRSMLTEKDQRCLDLAVKHNAFYYIFSNLWIELGESIRSLIIGNYNSISQSLRWMIESTALYVNM